NISENKTNISQENKENDIETDEKTNIRSSVHQYFTLNKKIKKYKCNYCSQKYKIPEDKSTSTLKRHLEKKYKNIITTEKIIGAIDKFVKKEELDATLEISASFYQTLSYTISIYNYLLDLIEKFLKKESYSNKIINAINKAKLKLQKYYPTTNGLVYIIST
ncbi:12942_t:CDS:2, partial [Racocetra persica]